MFWPQLGLKSAEISVYSSLKTDIVLLSVGADGALVGSSEFTTCLTLSK